MNPTHLTFMVLLGLCTTLHAQYPQFAIPAPEQPRDIAHDGSSIWMPVGADLYRINPETGAQLAHYLLPGNEFFGATFDGQDLWLSDRNNSVLLQVDTLDGTVSNTFSLPASYPSGLAWDGTNILMLSNQANQSVDSVFYINPTDGSVVNKEAMHLSNPYGLAHDGASLWSGEQGSGMVHQMNEQLSSGFALNAPGGLYPNGLAFDGTFLWVTNAASDSLFKIALSTGLITEETGVALDFTVYPNPASNRVFITDTEEIMNLSLIDIHGKRMPVNSFRNGIDVSALANGIYHVLITSKRGTQQKKLYVAH